MSFNFSDLMLLISYHRNCMISRVVSKRCNQISELKIFFSISSLLLKKIWTFIGIKKSLVSKRRTWPFSIKIKHSSLTSKCLLFFEFNLSFCNILFDIFDYIIITNYLSNHFESVKNKKSKFSPILSLDQNGTPIKQTHNDLFSHSENFQTLRYNFDKVLRSHLEPVTHPWSIYF